MITDERIIRCLFYGEPDPEVEALVRALTGEKE
jgi:hypothetical protein